MKGTAAATERRVDVASAVAALTGIIQTRLHLEFCNCVRTRQRRKAQLTQVIVARADAFDKIIVIPFTLSIDVHPHITASELTGGREITRGSGREH